MSLSSDNYNLEIIYNKIYKIYNIKNNKEVVCSSKIAYNNNSEYKLQINNKKNSIIISNMIFNSFGRGIINLDLFSIKYYDNKWIIDSLNGDGSIFLSELELIKLLNKFGINNSLNIINNCKLNNNTSIVI